MIDYTIITAFATVILVVVTWKYTDATKKMADTMYKQFVFENKPYLSVDYYREKPDDDPILEFKNHSEKSRINVRYDLYLIPPEKANNIIELQKPETLDKSISLTTEDINIEPNAIHRINNSPIIERELERLGIDTKKGYHYGIAIKGHYTPDIPDIGSFSIQFYWFVNTVKSAPENNIYNICKRLNFKLV